MAFPLPSSPHWAPTSTIAGTLENPTGQPGRREPVGQRPPRRRPESQAASTRGPPDQASPASPTVPVVQPVGAIAADQRLGERPAVGVHPGRVGRRCPGPAGRPRWRRGRPPPGRRGAAPTAPGGRARRAPVRRRRAASPSSAIQVRTGSSLTKTPSSVEPGPRRERARHGDDGLPRGRAGGPSSNEAGGLRRGHAQRHGVGEGSPSTRGPASSSSTRPTSSSRTTSTGRAQRGPRPRCAGRAARRTASGPERTPSMPCGPATWKASVHGRTTPVSTSTVDGCPEVRVRHGEVRGADVDDAAVMAGPGVAHRPRGHPAAQRATALAHVRRRRRRRPAPRRRRRR